MEVITPGKDGKGTVSGGNKGGFGRGKMGGPFPAGQVGNCICPRCSYKTANIAGQPCGNRDCLKCGAKITRER